MIKQKLLSIKFEINDNFNYFIFFSLKTTILCKQIQKNLKIQEYKDYFIYYNFN